MSFDQSDRFGDGFLSWLGQTQKSADPSSITFRVSTNFSAITFGERAEKTMERVCDRLDGAPIFFAATESGWRRYRAVFDAANVEIADVFDKAAPHCPEETVEAARAAYQRSGASIVVAIGGGSTLGIGKILSVEEGAYFIALPTTYSGSEMTQIFGRKIGHTKKTKRDTACIPAEVIYDPLLSQSLPIGETVQSGMNSLAHSIEALFTPNADTITQKTASIAINAHLKGLVLCCEELGSKQGRALAALGGFLGGVLIQRHGIALHHELCHVLGGLYDLPHGVSNSAVLSHAFAYNAPAARAAVECVATAFDDRDPAAAIHAFAQRITAPVALADYGLHEGHAREIVAKLLTKKFVNPRPLRAALLERMMIRAIVGKPPVIE